MDPRKTSRCFPTVTAGRPELSSELKSAGDSVLSFFELLPSGGPSSSQLCRGSVWGHSSKQNKPTNKTDDKKDPQGAALSGNHVVMICAAPRSQMENQEKTVHTKAGIVLCTNATE